MNKLKNRYILSGMIMLALQAHADDAIKLDEVEVVSKRLSDVYTGGQVTREVQYGLLGNLDFLDTPFSVTGYTAETVQNQQARTVTDLMANDASIRAFDGGDGVYDFFTIRGFPGTTSTHSFNGLYGVLPAQKMGLDGFERVEIIKGPTTLLTGSGPFGYAGGGVNFVPKRAADTPLTRLSLDYFGDGQTGSRIDIGRRFGEDNAFGIRFNGNLRDGATAIDKQSEHFGAGIMALDYRGEKARVTLDYGIQSYTIDNPTFALYTGAGYKIPSAPDSDHNMFPNWTKAYSKDNYLVLSGEYDFVPDWTVFGAIGRRDGDSYIAHAYTTIDDADGNTTVFPSFEPYKSHTNVSKNIGVRGKFQTSAVSHQVAAVASFLNYETGYTFTEDDFSFTSNIYNPVQTAIPAPFRGANKHAPSANRYTDSGYSLVDNMGFFEDTLNVILGARQQRVQQRSTPLTGSGVFTGEAGTDADKNRLSPSAGIVFKPREHVSIYANYMEGLSAAPVAEAGTSNPGQTFAPLVTKQVEIGSKMDWGTFTTTLAVFQIEQPSSYIDSITGEFKVTGEQRNRGVEFSTFGEVTNGVRVLGGVSYIDAEITKSDQDLLNGKQAVGVPEWGVNIGGEWDIFAVPGLTLTGRAIYTDKQYVDENNTQEIPSWTRVDLGARYAFKVYDKPTVVRLNVLNVFDRDYWSSAFGSRLSLGAPRTLSLSASFDF